MPASTRQSVVATAAMIFVERACEDGDYTGGATEKGPCFGLNRSVARARRQRAVPLLHRNRSLGGFAHLGIVLQVSPRRYLHASHCAPTHTHASCRAARLSLFGSSASRARPSCLLCHVILSFPCCCSPTLLPLGSARCEKACLRGRSHRIRGAERQEPETEGAKSTLCDPHRFPRDLFRSTI